MTVKRAEPPLRLAIEALKLARKHKAHPVFIERLEQRVSEEAVSFYNRLKLIDSAFPVVSCLKAGTTLTLASIDT